MGANQFEVRRPESDVTEAFRGAVEDARYERGHGGYTGTIAEKNEYVIWHGAPSTAGALALLQAPFATASRRAPAAIPDEICRAYDDKWGPAVAIADDETGGWIFCGWASS